MRQLIVFDWDGTLMDSLARICSCMQAAALDLQIEPASDLNIKGIVGLALDLAIQTLHPELSLEQVNQMRERYSHHYVVADQTPSSFFPGVESMLSSLHRKGHFLSVATGKSRRGLDRVFSACGVAGLFHSSRCADEAKSKPAPDMLLELLNLHGVTPDQAVMVGDTDFDLAMAAAAGVSSIGVSWGAHELTRLEKHNPVAIVESVAALSDLLHQEY